MERLGGVAKHHDWGSTCAIPEFTGEAEGTKPVAELWFGAHPLGASSLESGGTLRERIEADPAGMLGPSTRFSLGDELPYLVKLIAPAFPLSVQVHPGRRRAQSGFLEEEDQGLPVGSPTRSFQDETHKPEMVYALTQFDGLVGFAVRRQARERLENLASKTASRLSRRLLLAKGRGVKPVVSWILDPSDGPSPADVTEFAAACEARLAAGNSPVPLIDEAVVDLHERFGPDPAILIAFLMNHLRLEPGEAAFVPTGTVHSYQHGLGLEIMANSDNVVRGGLTSKHVDRDLFLELGFFDGTPPTRIAPEHPLPGINHFRSPVEDFELITAEPSAPGVEAPLPLPGSGPRILIGLDGAVTVRTVRGAITLSRGEAAFLADSDGSAVAEGRGTLALCAVP